MNSLRAISICSVVVFSIATVAGIQSSNFNENVRRTRQQVGGFFPTDSDDDVVHRRPQFLGQHLGEYWQSRVSELGKRISNQMNKIRFPQDHQRETTSFGQQTGYSFFPREINVWNRPIHRKPNREKQELSQNLVMPQRANPEDIEYNTISDNIQPTPVTPVTTAATHVQKEKLESQTSAPDFFTFQQHLYRPFPTLPPDFYQTSTDQNFSKLNNSHISNTTSEDILFTSQSQYPEYFPSRNNNDKADKNDFLENKPGNGSFHVNGTSVGNAGLSIYIDENGLFQLQHTNHTDPIVSEPEHTSTRTSTHRNDEIVFPNDDDIVIDRRFHEFSEDMKNGSTSSKSLPKFHQGLPVFN